MTRSLQNIVEEDFQLAKCVVEPEPYQMMEHVPHEMGPVTKQEDELFFHQHHRDPRHNVFGESEDVIVEQQQEFDNHHAMVRLI